MTQRVALVTGSSKGIGKGIAKKLLENGYRVYLNGRNEEVLQRVADGLRGDIKVIASDLSIEPNIQKTIETIINSEKRLDLVVANIGSGKSLNGWQVELSEYKRVFDINFFSAVSLATHSIEYMKEHGGQIIFISSIAGCEAIGAPIAYSSAKTALLSFAKSLSNTVAQFNIRVNSISPGNVMFDGSTWDDKIKNNEDAVKTYIQQNVPLNGFATTDDIAEAVLYLEKSRFTTGSNIVVDGGQLHKII
jgi:3-oxoacyl-[acyl-carrier protein] reductase